MMPRIESLFQRHVHLDFHTSEHIDNIGGRFTRENFQAALRAGRLDAITVFAKCHHSWCYFPTKVGRPHPNLKIDLLGEQIAACHEMGVKAPIYITVGWSATDAAEHPEWWERCEDGSAHTCSFDVEAPPERAKPTFSWIWLCPSGAYRDHIVALTREIVGRYDVDGLFYDICAQPPCYCDRCRAGMARTGLTPADYNVHRWTDFMAQCNDVLHAVHPNATVFYNGNAGLTTAPAIEQLLTHFELEDLPTTWGGYDKFPLRAKHFMNKGKPRLAMSGKFHTSWGEFGGFKHRDALWFEAAAMVSYGASVSFGDQVHPDGEMELATYENVGHAQAYVEQIAEYGLSPDTRGYATLGLWLSGSNADDQGVANMLLEQTDFDVVGADTRLTEFETVILPGARCLDLSAAAKLAAFVDGGGKLLVLGESALDAAGERFLLDMGVEYGAPGRYDCDYTVAGELLDDDLPAAPFLNYEPAIRALLTGAEVLATLREPYFSRTYGHYCSHQNTANRREMADHPAATRKGNVVWLAHRLGRLYHDHGARVHRQLFINALGLVHQRPALTVSLPSAGRANLLHQPAARRYVAHLLYGPPLSRGRCSVIEDLVELRDVRVSVRVPQAVSAARLAPSGVNLPLTYAAEQVTVTVPSMRGHTAVVFDY